MRLLGINKFRYTLFSILSAYGITYLPLLLSKNCERTILEEKNSLPESRYLRVQIGEVLLVNFGYTYVGKENIHSIVESIIDSLKTHG